MIKIDTLEAMEIKEPVALTIGKFDGVHRGHEKLLSFILEKKEEGLKTAVFTFQIPPKVGIQQEALELITTNQEKERLFEKMGVDYLICCPVVPEVMHMQPEDFIQMLVQKLHVVCITAGTDCRFGHNRSGNANTLEAYGKAYGIEVRIFDKVRYEDRDISSTFIRSEIKEAHMEKVEDLLGYPYFVTGIVEKGNQLGRTIDVPTLNVVPEKGKLLPPFGVYATKTWIAGKPYFGMTNVGKKPTIHGENPVGVETNLFDFSGDLYGKEIHTEFFTYIRPEKKFDSFDLLKEQIYQDREKIRAYFQTK